MDISAIAREFIDINERRKELERREEYLKGLLVQHFQATGVKQVETDRGKVSYLEAQKVEYDIPLLRHVLPPPVFDMVAKVSINDSVLSQLVRDGKIDAVAVESARKVTYVHRVVAQAMPLATGKAATLSESLEAVERGERAAQDWAGESVKAERPGGRPATAKPAAPAKSAKPAEPAKPATASRSPKPAESAEPAKSATPAKPATSAKPPEPARPSDSAKPAQPAKPSKPGKPAKPSEPAKPAEPATPAVPAKPGSPAKPATPAKPARAVPQIEPAGPAARPARGGRRRSTL